MTFTRFNNSNKFSLQDSNTSELELISQLGKENLSVSQFIPCTKVLDNALNSLMFIKTNFFFFDKIIKTNIKTLKLWY